jgi:hypothetical protein
MADDFALDADPFFDDMTSKRLFGRHRFLGVVRAVHRLSCGGDYFTRRNIERLLGIYGAIDKELAPLVELGILSEQFYERYEYRYFLVDEGSSVWRGLLAIALIEVEA